jgi:hypothetical protein
MHGRPWKPKLLPSAVLVALAVLLVAGAAGARAQGPGEDSVAGEARQCLSNCDNPPFGFGVALTVDARSGPEGGDPSGVITWFEGGPTPGSTRGLSGTVTCLHVDRAAAVIGFSGRVTTSDLEFEAGFARVVDGGGPGSGLDSFEVVITEFAFLRPPPGPTDCAAVSGSGTVYRNETGDLVVVDAPSRPTSKQQCKDGGWRGFGDLFKNQGQCVAFVQRRPRRA